MAGLLGSHRGAGTSAERIPSVRILIVGNAGAGKTCIAHLMATGSPAKGVRQTVGCSTSVVLVEPADSGGLSDARQRPIFIELWDIGAHERYKTLRSSFYADISGVIIVTDSASSRSQASVRKWAAEVAAKGRFVAPMPPDQAAANPGSLPVPCLVINNKADLRGMGMRRGVWLSGWSRGFLVWLETIMRQFKFRRKLKTLLRPASSSGLSDERLAVTVISASAAQGIIDEAAVDGFFAECIARRLNPGAAGAGAAAAKFVRRPTSGGAGGGGGSDFQSARKRPPIAHSPYSADGPPPPAYSPSPTPQLPNGGPHSASSWGGFSRTTSFHSTMSSTGDYGWAGDHGHSAVDDSDDLV
ncbi:P-loop containing nucleoside triphosphate hydrolase protein [Coccomyxa subellipsoidea C-169]|uniref:P-loop containing nucleoside triphosphate hydrolase protein n=1 Tax=Coccomyxa subellipsoidea (strain C-169) TaxID=574566 RepID=I0Z4W7_COCSC|nr:P-loop containing nucleoside triphosphate hydrolase protein [Coccomyxa subellipsoidea C-169]EIE25686.1 P-loop containing nucleoside triphosphate hydrolase protein [Coccomyxa subellipsoidea C-169]|eukprot:XP_005650230.1 P-loop containing nucleoside triphosphate hydrolase protein [Coccomyxa subellipsoidea C-169]